MSAVSPLHAGGLRPVSSLLLEVFVEEETNETVTVLTQRDNPGQPGARPVCYWTELTVQSSTRLSLFSLGIQGRAWLVDILAHSGVGFRIEDSGGQELQRAGQPPFWRLPCGGGSPDSPADGAKKDQILFIVPAGAGSIRLHLRSERPLPPWQSHHAAAAGDVHTLAHENAPPPPRAGGL